MAISLSLELPVLLLFSLQSNAKEVATLMYQQLCPFPIDPGTYNTHPTLPNFVSLINGNGIVLGVAGLVAILTMIFIFFFIKILHLAIDFLKSFTDEASQWSFLVHNPTFGVSTRV
jgi:hypothetical protein